MLLQQPEQNDEREKGISTLVSKFREVIKVTFDHLRFQIGILLTLLSAMCFAISNILYHITGKSNPPLKVTLWSGMFIMISSIVVLAVIRPSITTTVKDIPFIILVGFFGSSGTILEVIAIIIGYPGDAIALYFTLPVVLVIFEAFINRKIPRCAPFCFAVLTVVGEAFVAKPQFLFPQSDSTSMNGTAVSFALVGAILFGVFFLGVGKLQNLNTHPLLIVAFYSGLLVVLSSILCLYFDTLTLPNQSLTTILFILTGMNSFLAYWLISLALKIEKPSYVSVFLTSEVALTYFLQYAVLKVPLSWLSLAGGVIITAGCVGIALTKDTQDDSDERNEEEPLVE